MSFDEFQHGNRIWTSDEAAAAVRAGFDAFRDHVRGLAEGSFGDDALPAAVISIVERFDVLDDEVLATFGQASPRGPDAHELAEVADAGRVPPAEFSDAPWAYPSRQAWRHDARDGVRRSQP